LMLESGPDSVVHLQGQFYKSPPQARNPQFGDFACSFERIGTAEPWMGDGGRVEEWNAYAENQKEYIVAQSTRLLKKWFRKIDIIHYREGLTDKLQYFPLYPVFVLIILF
jgi:hypothetical protein